MRQIDIRSHNRDAWNQNVADGNPYTKPVSPEIVQAAREGNWSVVLTDRKPVPRSWLPELDGIKILGLACGGGQQGPIFAAVGADVTILDNSPAQLEHDNFVAEREGLNVNTVEGDMRDLSMFIDESFDLIFHPISNVFVDNVQAVWRECYRILHPGGVLLAGFMNPDCYIFDLDLLDNHRKLKVRYSLPYADVDHLSERKKARYLKEKLAFEYSHSLDVQIGGQLEAGFLITGFYEDRYQNERDDLLSKYIPTFFATKAIKPVHGN